MKTREKIMYGLGAVAAGVVAGILLAPKSGKETRKDIANKMGEVKDKSSELLEEGKEFAKSTLDKAKEYIDKQEMALNGKSK